jgi:hypothetical protein
MSIFNKSLSIKYKKYIKIIREKLQTMFREKSLYLWQLHYTLIQKDYEKTKATKTGKKMINRKNLHVRLPTKFFRCNSVAKQSTEILLDLWCLSLVLIATRSCILNLNFLSFYLKAWLLCCLIFLNFMQSKIKLLIKLNK